MVCITEGECRQPNGQPNSHPDSSKPVMEGPNHGIEMGHHKRSKPRTSNDLQLDAQNSYLFTYNTFIKILYMFRALPCSSSGGLRRNCIYAASGIITLCR